LARGECHLLSENRHDTCWQRCPHGRYLVRGYTAQGDDAKRQINYHRRDEELAELEAVLAGHRRFADLPPRV
jgi:hypothetical protein